MKNKQTRFKNFILSTSRLQKTRQVIIDKFSYFKFHTSMFKYFLRNINYNNDNKNY